MWTQIILLAIVLIVAFTVVAYTRAKSAMLAMGKPYVFERPVWASFFKWPVESPVTFTILLVLVVLTGILLAV